MRRERLRPAHDQHTLSAVYHRPHDHTPWVDHRLRVTFTVALAEAVRGGLRSGADLSCGDGAILRAMPLDERHFGDFAPGWPYRGPIEDTIGEIPDVDLFVCCETLEHLDDPDAVLGKIRPKAARLLMSTPVDNWGDANREHYWAWDREAVEAMLAAAGFTVSVYLALDVRPSGADYCFGIWACT